MNDVYGGTTEYDDGLCERCHKNPASNEVHSCPYNEDVNNDHEPCCTCCDDCMHECAMDI